MNFNFLVESIFKRVENRERFDWFRVLHLNFNKILQIRFYSPSFRKSVNIVYGRRITLRSGIRSPCSILFWIGIPSFVGAPLFRVKTQCPSPYILKVLKSTGFKITYFSLYTSKRLIYKGSTRVHNVF